MKKIIALLLAIVMMMALATVASAAEDDLAVTLTKNYKLTNAGTISPAEEFTFTELTCTDVKDAAAGVTTANAPVPTIGSVSYAQGDAGKTGAMTKNVTITVPNTYTSVGVYTYTFSEVDGKTAGVTYREDAITLVVTVTQGDDGKLRVAAVHTEDEGKDKSNQFDNTYSAGNLTVTKEVTGNLGDQSKEFPIVVKFTAPEGLTVKEAISYNDGAAGTIAGNWDTYKEVTINVKHGETVTFSNIPYGVEYEVTEAKPDGYDEPKIEGGTGTIAAATQGATVTNNKQATVDTGIAMDSVPFIVMAVIAVLGLAAFTAKKRVQE